MTAAEPLIAHLDELRRARGLSLAEWARRAGVGEATIRQLRNGTSTGGLGTVRALAGVLDLEVWALPRAAAAPSPPIATPATDLEEHAVKPPIPYFGGKMTVGPLIARLLPEHGHYVEPYCGSLAVLLAKPPSDHETVNDLDQRIVTFWRVLRDRPDELARACALTPHSRIEHESADILDAADDLELSRQVFVRLTQGRSGQLRRTGWRSYINPAGSSSSMPDYLAGYVARIAPAAERLQHVSLEALPALEIVAKYGDQPDVLLYVDPPYLGSTRTRSWDGYEHDMRSEADHRELAKALRAARAAVVVSGYASDLYDRELYAGWDRHTIAAGTGQGATWANRTEVLWSNRPIGAQLELFPTTHDHEGATG